MHESRPGLRTHQVAGIEWINRVGRGLLADEPGLGKTRQAIEAFDGGRNLIIAPAMVIDSGTWDDELARWSADPSKWTQATYTKLNQRQTLATGGNRPLAGLPRPEFAGPWDAIVVDEAHYTKNRGTNWTETVEMLAKSSGALLEMTGTPISHWANDLFPMLRCLHPSETRPGARFGSYWRWVGEWFDVQPSRFGGANARVIGDLLACDRGCLKRPPSDPCDHYREFMRANLGDRFLLRRREDVLDLPPLTIQKVLTPLDVAQRRMYKEIKKDFATKTAEGASFEAWSTGSQVSAMMKLTTSAWLLDKKGPPKGGKLEVLREDLANRTRPTLVLAHYRDSLEACEAVAASQGLTVARIDGSSSASERRNAVVGFQHGELDVLVGSLEVVSEGLNLTVSDQVIFVEKSFKPSRNKQARDRIHRMGQIRPCTAREYVAPKSLDEEKDKMLAVKTDRQMRMLAAPDFLKMM